ncbi:MAG: HNH endonuclease [Bradyrhizobium sp.]
MNVTSRSPNTNEGQFVTEADWIPGFWNYLLDLDRDDLIAELVQNDLDQDATRTVISFERDHLICEGNGRAVEADGWQRLRKIQGAGNSVPAKRGKIGVKNHGLKTAFTIGDEIRLMSAGQAVVQTLYANGRRKPPHPGASPAPVPDSEAPSKGCRIIIRYRTAAIEPPHGEANVLGPVGTEEIDALFHSACASAPEQFAGIVSPEVAPRYEIVLRHWRLGEGRFEFSCTKPRKIARQIELFRRRCTVHGTFSGLPEGLQEQAARRPVPIKGRLRERIADFFRRGGRFFVEVSWSVDGRGKPKTGTGRFRYPIGYPVDSHQARTGHGAHFNAPFASDNKRHGPARNEATNADLRVACEALLIDLLARHSVPRWGPDGLNPLVPSPGADNQDEAVRPLLAALASQGAMPTLAWTAAMALLEPRTRKSNAAARRIVVRPSAAEARRYRFIIPAPTWASDTFDSALSIISPRSELQLDPRTHTSIVELLTDRKTSGFGQTFVTFDEQDAFSRITDGGNDYFGAPSAPEAELALPVIARAYLDLIHSAIGNESCDDDTEEQLQGVLLLPDLNSQPVPFRLLHSSAILPSDVPGLTFPPILHPALAAHPLFRRRNWYRSRYTMASFLQSGTLQSADEGARRLFWTWLRGNERRIVPSDRPKLAEIAIWPDGEGRLCALGDFCDPRSRRVASVLSTFIRQPHEHVRRSWLVSSGDKARRAIRRTPTNHEVSDWLNDRLALFPLGTAPDAQTISALAKFETDLATLLQDIGAAHALKSADMALPALAQDGSIYERATLVMSSHAVERLALPARYLLRTKQRSDVLDKLSPALKAPTAAMLLDAFAEDGANFAALQVRLHQFMSITEPGDDGRIQLADLPTIPLHGSPLPPSALAFIGPKGDYWGTWKKRLSGKGLSQEDQRRYRDAGVTSAMPDLETSRAFFTWLSGQEESVVQRHVGCVLRHIQHRDGPVHWADTFTGVPFIPVLGRDGVRLVSLRSAQRRPIFLPDAEDVAKAIVQFDPAALLVIDRIKEVAEPVREPLRSLGVRSLREALKEPESVAGAGETSPAGAEVIKRLRALRSRRFHQTFFKRLSALGVETGLVRHDWHDRLSRIKSVRFAESVEARYRFRDRLYPVAADAGFDPDTGTFWIKKDRDVELSSLYEAIAAQLVFKPSARPVHCLALGRALDLEIFDPSYGRPAGTTNNHHATDAEEADALEESTHDEDGGDADPGEAVFGHSPFEPDPSRNTPHPGPILSIPAAPSPLSGRGRGSSGNHGGHSKAKPAPELELQHIDALKRSHYASHCQVCLCERPPRELAPPGSYIQWEEVRRRVVEAHHVDLKSAGGARHAGNLILLCKLHHDNYGRRLTRAAITEALQGDTPEKIVRFGVDGEAVTEVEGRQIELTIPDTGEVVEIFFTAQHADYWLSQMSPLANATGATEAASDRRPGDELDTNP